MRRSDSMCRDVLMLCVIILLLGSAETCNRLYAQSIGRDPQAVVLLSQCSAVLGDPTTFMGLSLTGTVERAESGAQVPFTYKAKGVAQSLFTIQGSSGNETHRQSGGHAQVRLSNGVLKAKPDIAVRYSWPQLIPGLICYWPLADTTFSAHYVESTVVQGVQVDHLRIHAVVLNSNGIPDPDEALLSTIDLYLNSGTHLPLRTTVRAFGNTGMQNSIPVDTFYSKYAPFQGTVFPTSITEFANGTLDRTLNIQAVVFHQVFADSDFTLEQQQ